MLEDQRPQQRVIVLLGLSWKRKSCVEGHIVGKRVKKAVIVGCFITNKKNSLNQHFKFPMALIAGIAAHGGTQGFLPYF